MGSAIVAAGFILSSMAITLLRVLSFCEQSPCYPHYEIAGIRRESLCAIAKRLSVKQSKWVERADGLYPVAVHDKLSLQAPLREWLERRWNNFHVSINSSVALAIALLTGLLFFEWGESYYRCVAWAAVNVIVFGSFCFNGCQSFRENRRMLDFVLEEIPLDAPRKQDSSGTNAQTS